ncbi:MAG: FtsL-like putative cell division protein [Mesonia sp.]
MQLKMKSAIEKRVQGTGIAPSNTPPQKIKINL